uniref:LRRCT domain-containing protein n=1 Tax=Meloidogyne hapla TaxID=6305 RepID=A0A1I8BVJ3_MELHA
MPDIFRALFSLNNTKIDHLHVWNSLINILPKDMFSKIKLDKLTIVDSSVGIIRKDAFSNVENNLKELSLRNNIIKTIDEKIFLNLTSLKLLDLSGNKLSQLKHVHFSKLVNLETLLLDYNQINSFDYDIFNSLTKLRTLSISNNRLTKITKDVFKNLQNLESLNLQNNFIESIDDDSFSYLLSLKHLDISNNKIGKLKIANLAKLETLFLSNNLIEQIEDINLQNLSNLITLHLENNKISKISNEDFKFLKKSQKLYSLILDGNNISWIDCFAFEPIKTSLTILSLQKNKINSFSCSSTNDPLESKNNIYLDRSLFELLNSLQKLFLSYNNINSINEGDLNGLFSLQELILDHNKIIKISSKSFEEIKNLKKLFLNNNLLYYLPKGIFNNLNISNLISVDISENKWECICEQEWIGFWLSSIGQANTPSGTLGCLIGKCENIQQQKQLIIIKEEENQINLIYWIRLISFILAISAILFLIIAGYVYVQENRLIPLLQFSSSDTIQLIPSNKSKTTIFSFSNPLNKNSKEIFEEEEKDQNAYLPSLSIQSKAGKVVIAKEEENNEIIKKEKKVVRFCEK